MNNKFRLVLSVLLLAAFGYLGYVTFPRTRQITYTVTKAVAAQRTRSYTTTIQVDGKPREVTIEIPETTPPHYVAEHRVRNVPATVSDWFQFVVIVVLVFCGFYYIWIVLSDLNRIKKAGKTTAQSRDTFQRADKLASTLVGVLVGVAGTTTYFKSLPTPPPMTINQPDESNDGSLTDEVPPADEMTAPMPKDEHTPAVGDPGTPQFHPNPPKQ